MKETWIDTHAHLYVDQFSEDQNEVIQRAFDSQIQKIYLPNIDLESIAPMLEMVSKYPDHLFPMMGLHPCSVTQDYQVELDYMYDIFERHKFSGVGETGIDLYWDISTKQWQQESFDQQIAWALEFDLPIIIHSRSALDLTIEMIENRQNGGLRGIFHCFDGTFEQAQRIINVGFYMGIGGSITYKKSKTVEVIERVGLEYIVLETDAPYLSPVPKRGKRNESTFLRYTASFIAERLNLSLPSVSQVTTRNAEGRISLQIINVS